MEATALVPVIQKLNNELPPHVRRDLGDVKVWACPGIDNAVEALKEHYPEEDLPEIPADTKGIFFGHPMEVEADDGDDDEIVSVPEGVIILIAANIATLHDAAIVLLHEVGHALGMSEEDVDNLGLSAPVEDPPNADKTNDTTAG